MLKLSAAIAALSIAAASAAAQTCTLSSGIGGRTTGYCSDGTSIDVYDYGPGIGSRVYVTPPMQVPSYPSPNAADYLRPAPAPAPLPARPGSILDGAQQLQANPFGNLYR